MHGSSLDSHGLPGQLCAGLLLCAWRRKTVPPRRSHYLASLPLPDIQGSPHDPPARHTPPLVTLVLGPLIMIGDRLKSRPLPGAHATQDIDDHLITPALQ